MNAKRVASLCLSLLLAGLLVRCWLIGAGDLKVHGLLLIGSLLGAIYAARGSVPAWMMKWSGDSLTADDAPANLSPRVYLAVLLAALVIAAVALAIGLAVL